MFFYFNRTSPHAFCVFHRDLSDVGCFWRSHALGGDRTGSFNTCPGRYSPPHISSTYRFRRADTCKLRSGLGGSASEIRAAKRCGGDRDERRRGGRTRYVKNSFGQKCTYRRSEDKNKVQFTWFFFSVFLRRPTRCRSKLR